MIYVLFFSVPAKWPVCQQESILDRVLWVMGQTANGKNPAPIGIDVYNNIKPIIGDSHILEWPSTRWYGKYWNHLERADFFHQLRMALCVGPYGWQRYSCEWNCSAIAAEYKIREFSQQNDPNNFWFLNSTWTSKMSSNVGHRNIAEIP